MKIPQFSRWMRFDEMRKEQDAKKTGVYLLAHLNSKKDKKGPVLDKVIYVGETTKQTITERLYQFGRSAFLNKFAHSGGTAYFGECLSHKTRENPPKNLYAAILPVDIKNKEEQTAYIKYVERLVILKYIKKHRELPICNKI